MTKNTPYKPTVCLDFNGVLDQYVGFNNGAEYPPREGCEKFLKRLAEKYKVVICTAADPAKITDWLKKYGLWQYIDIVTSHKPPALVYLDDRAVRFDGDFGKALEEIENFKAYWEDPLPIFE